MATSKSAPTASQKHEEIMDGIRSVRDHQVKSEASLWEGVVFILTFLAVLVLMFTLGLKIGESQPAEIVEVPVVEIVEVANTKVISKTEEVLGDTYGNIYWDYTYGRERAEIVVKGDNGNTLVINLWESSNGTFYIWDVDHQVYGKTIDTEFLKEKENVEDMEELVAELLDQLYGEPEDKVYQYLYEAVFE